MKAFQLKVMIKNSKPPIWRRVVVPSGITFSQLSMIFNEVMGWYDIGNKKSTTTICLCLSTKCKYGLPNVNNCCKGTF